MKKLLTIIFIFYSISGTSALNLDSLLNVWNTQTNADTIRLKAIGNIAWHGHLFSKPDSAIYYAKMQYGFAKETNNTLFMASALNTQGAAHWIQDNYKKAIELYLESLKINEDSGNEEAMASTLNNIGLIYQKQGNLHEAQKYYERSLETFINLGLMQAITGPLNNIGIIYKSLGNYSLAMDYFERSMNIAEEFNILPSISEALNNMGEIYRELGEQHTAMEHFKRSLVIDEELRNNYNLAKTINNIGLIYNSQRNYHEALGNYLISLEISEDIGDKIGMAKTLSLAGNIYEKQGELSKAMNYYERSLATQNEIGDKQGKAISYINIANIYHKRNNLSKSISYGNQGLAIAIKLGLPKEIRDASRILHVTNKIAENYDESLTMHETYISMRDSIVNKNNTRVLIQQDYKYKYEKKKAIQSAKHNKEMALSKERKKRQELVSYGTSFGLATMLILAFIFNNRFQLTKKQRTIIKIKNRHITESIRYAKRIQEASLTSPDLLGEIFTEHFVFFQPKEIVSGDFFWAHKINNDVVMVAVCDCTGHGVPGAFMSMIGNYLLNEVIIENNITEVNLALNELNEKVSKTLKQDTETADTLDGIDISLLCINKTKKTINFSGAGHSLFISRGDKLLETKGDAYPIGYTHVNLKNYSRQEVQLEKDDTIYLFTDGITQQYGGKNNELYGNQKLKRLLLKHKKETFKLQETQIYRSFNNWKGGRNQDDDVCLIGFKV